MKSFMRFVERLYKENYLTLHERLVTEKIPCTVVSASTVSDTKKFIERLRAEGLIIDRLLLTPPPQENFSVENVISDVEVSSLKDFPTLNPKPRFIFVDVEIDYKFAATIGDPSVTILKPPLKLSTTRAAVDACMSNISKLFELYQSFIDDESRKTLCGYWLSRVTRKFGEIVEAPTPHYVCRGFIPNHGDIVIDVGVCDGVTSAWFAGLGCKVYAFEMDHYNYELAKTLAQDKNFTLENFGLGSFKHEMRYSHDENNIGGSFLNLEGDRATQIITLDSYVIDKGLPRVDFIKLDVEGAEFDVIKGAATSIARWKPLLAVSAYHKLDDFWKLASLIKSICPDYEFALRHFRTSRDNELLTFRPEIEQLFVEYDLDDSIISIGECVLFAR
ncbi:MAG: FkbM family methyltransferase [Selenomonadaceae bacterium]|nr:FkbM family methyltransferase [Selenomonadaceae bacterium]